MFLLKVTITATFFAGSMHIPLPVEVRLPPMASETYDACIKARDRMRAIIPPIPEDMAKREQMGVTGMLESECSVFNGW